MPTSTPFGGWAADTEWSGSGSGCNTKCGYYAVGFGNVTVQAARWEYIDDFTCLGPFNSTGTDDSTDGGRNFPFGEAGLYLYPGLDTSHGNTISAGLGFNVGASEVTSSGNGTTAAVALGEVVTGDCNNTANTLNFAGSVNGLGAGNASAYGNANNADAYACAYIYSPGGAGPQFLMGSDDGIKVWLNGTQIWDDNASRGYTVDQDNAGAISVPAGWSRVLLKNHNGSSGWQCGISLRNGVNVNLTEPSMDAWNYSGYYSYGVGFEQNAWYPAISPSSFYGNTSLATGGSYYGNSTTVNIAGTSGIASGCPVPYWQTMYYMWGYGLSGDSTYGAVSGTPTSTSWTHSQTGVTGHRRFHLFAVSRSGRTSGQASGQTGGWTWQDSGSYARYYDVYIDNVPPAAPSFSSASAASTSTISLGWAIPLDQGVNIANSATMATTGISSGGANGFVVGSVGVNVYRNGTSIYGWNNGTSYTDTGLSANTSYTYTIAAEDNYGGTYGSWNNSTGPQGSTSAWTLSVAPTSGSVTPSTAFQCSSGSAVTWTAVGGFGAGHIQNYRYVWDQNATHTWADTESLWSSGTLNTTPTSGGNWYLHVKGYNGAAVGNGTYDYAVVVSQGTEKWTGGNGNWDFSTTGLWQDATPNAVTYCDGHAVLLDDSASVSTPAVTLTTAVAPSSVTNNSTKNYTIAGTGKITGSASLTKQGASTLTLSTANDYSGITTVSAGTLALSGSGSIAGSPTNIVASGATFNVSAVTGGFHLASGQTLTGTGTNLGPVTINSGATLAPGAGATLGTLTVSNNLTLAGSANLRISKSGSTLTSDQIAGTGTLTKGGTLNVTLVSGSSPLADGDTFPLFSAASSTGAFAVTNLPSVGAGTNWWTTNNYGTLTLNVWPTAGGVTYSRAQGISLKIKIADVLTNLTGAITGKTIGLAGVGTSTNSATITTNSTYIFYSPATGNNNDEYFSYTATDGRGGSPANNIYVTVIKWTGTAQTITVTNNTVTLNFAGIPNYGYAIQRSTNLTDWVTLVTTNAPSAGLFQWTDDFSDLGGPPASAYYRLQQP